MIFHSCIANLRLRNLFLCLLAVTCFLNQETNASDQPAGVIGKGETWATSWYLLESGEPGPTVLITGGIHGNEPAGVAAAEQIQHWNIKHGKLVVIPQVNRLGLKADMRWIPMHRNDSKLKDLNRNFPTESAPEPRSELALELWELVKEIKPDLVVDLHEGFDFHNSNPKSVGSSVIFAKSIERTELANLMLEAVNKTITNEEHKLVPLAGTGAVIGSLVRACQDELQVDGFILETTFRGQPLSLRTRQHRLMVSTLLQKIGMIESDQTSRFIRDADAGVIHIGMFDGAGASSNGLANFHRLFDESERYHLSHLGPADMTSDVLQQFDVLLFPGGSGSKQGQAIGETGRDAIRKFANGGGGVLGICAGAYLCSSHYDWSLNLINTAVFNRTIDIPGVGRKSMWYRGESKLVEIEIAAQGENILGFNDLKKVIYHNGPIMSRGKNETLPDFTTLAWFRSEVSRYDAQKGTMIDTPAIITAPYGEGRVLCISPHPEATTEIESMILSAIDYVSGR